VDWVLNYFVFIDYESLVCAQSGHTLALILGNKQFTYKGKFMAVKKKSEDVVQLFADDEISHRPRLHKLIVQNFRSIGFNAVEIELDDIVVLVGPNNVGKSSILRAYETVMSHGSKEGKLSINISQTAKLMLKIYQR
jgi:ATPase subunit of ABC transporter with duplicated ATPase domains